MTGSGVLSAVGYVSPDSDLTYLADHAIVIALPFVLPVLLVVVMVAVVAYRDRHRKDDEPEEQVSGRNTAADPGPRQEGEHG
jgi:hypothetical protein